MNLATMERQVEVVSDYYATRFGIRRSSDWFLFKLQEEVAALVRAYLEMQGQVRLKGVSSTPLRDTFEQELADVFCHVILLARHFEVDLETAVSKKWLTKLLA